VRDGFKRLERWRAEGVARVPVVVERAPRVVDQKRLLLAANAPARTLTAIDEARVVCSLIEDDKLTRLAVARLLGRKVAWGERRGALGTRLCPRGERRVAHGAIGPSLAHALCGVSAKDQEALVASIERHELKAREAVCLVSAFRVAHKSERAA